MATASMNSAFAADIPARTQAPAPAPTFVSGWQGFYVGGSVGGSWLNSRTDDSLANPWGWDYSVSGKETTATKLGPIAGLQAGYNFQSRNLVFGVEGDFSFLTAKSVGRSIITNDNGYSADTTKTNKISHLGTLRGRLGVDVNGTMPYLTAGIAFGRVANHYVTIDNGYGADTDSKSKKWKAGFVVGGGIEHKLTDKISIKGEVLFAGFGSKSRSVPSDYVSNNGGSIKYSNDLTIGRVGLNYRF
jgi:outer membrane immunogenic protein